MQYNIHQNPPFTKTDWLHVLEIAKQDVVAQVWNNDACQRFEFAYISCFPCTEDGNFAWRGLLDTLIGERIITWDSGVYYGVRDWIDSDIRAKGGIYDCPTTIDDIVQVPAYEKLASTCTHYPILYTDYTYDEMQVKEQLQTGELQFTPSLCKVFRSPLFE